MTRQRVHITIDALTVEGARLSRAALTEAIHTALAERLSTPQTPLHPQPAAIETLSATAQPTRQGSGRETAIGRAVAQATHGVLKS